MAKMEEAEVAAIEAQRQRDTALQESQQRWREETARLEEALREAQAQGREQGLRASLSEGQAGGLEEQLAQGEATRRGLEHRLDGLESALRRTLGIGRRGRSPTPGARGRSPSPWRTRSPVKGEDLLVCLLISQLFFH